MRFDSIQQEIAGATWIRFPCMSLASKKVNLMGSCFLTYTYRRNHKFTHQGGHTSLAIENSHIDAHNNNKLKFHENSNFLDL